MKERRRLKLLAYTDSEVVGGAEISLGNLLRALAPAIEVAVLATDAAVGQAVAAYRTGTPVLTARAPTGFLDSGALAAHLRAVRAFKPDILHANQAWPWACEYGELAALMTPRVRVVAVDQLAVSSAMPRRRILARRALARRLHVHVAVGERAARLIESIVGLRAGSVGSVPNGVPPAPLDPDPPPNPAPAPVIGSLGRLTEQKGYDLLVRSLPELPEATLVLVGDGPERARLEALASELGVAHRLHITGWVAEAPRYLPTFDVFALPSRWEGMPLAILEAMHAGLPVLAADVGSVADAVSDGDTGYVVPRDDLRAVQDRLGRLLADPALRSRMGARGRIVAGEQFTDTVMAQRYEGIYRSLVGNRATLECPTAWVAGGS